MLNVRRQPTPVLHETVRYDFDKEPETIYSGNLAYSYILNCLLSGFHTAHDTVVVLGSISGQESTLIISPFIWDCFG